MDHAYIRIHERGKNGDQFMIERMTVILYLCVYDAHENDKHFHFGQGFVLTIQTHHVAIFSCLGLYVLKIYQPTDLRLDEDARK